MALVLMSAPVAGVCAGDRGILLSIQTVFTVTPEQSPSITVASVALSWRF